MTLCLSPIKQCLEENASDRVKAGRGGGRVTWETGRQTDKERDTQYSTLVPALSLPDSTASPDNRP